MYGPSILLDLDKSTYILFHTYYVFREMVKTAVHASSTTFTVATYRTG